MSNITYNCPSCGANIVDFNEHSEYTCPYCSSHFSFQEVKEIVKEAMEKAATKDKASKEYQSESVTYSCKNCGAQIISDENTVATFCIYCHSQNIAIDKAMDHLAPDMVLPFIQTKQQAIEGFKRWTQGVSFLPDGFYSTDQIEKLTTLYAPFWLFKYHVDFELKGTGTRVKHWTANNYRHTETSYFNIHKKGVLQYDTIPVDGSLALNNERMNQLEPFDFTKLVPFDMAYLVGHYADTYDDDKVSRKHELENHINSRLHNQMHDLVSGYATFDADIESAQLKADYDSYALLPLWFLNYRHQNIDYMYTMNGQSGKIIGDLPIDKAKQKQYRTQLFIKIGIGMLLIAAFSAMGA